MPAAVAGLAGGSAGRAGFSLKGVAGLDHSQGAAAGSKRVFRSSAGNVAVPGGSLGGFLKAGCRLIQKLRSAGQRGLEDLIHVGLLVGVRQMEQVRT